MSVVLYQNQTNYFPILTLLNQFQTVVNQTKVIAWFLLTIIIIVTVTSTITVIITDIVIII